MGGPGRPRCAAMAVPMAAAAAVLAGCSGGPAKPVATGSRLTEANKPVEQAVAILRSQLGLPPPETS